MTTEKTENKAVVMLKGLRLNMFNDGLYNPEVELATKGKQKGKNKNTWSSKFIFPPKDSPAGKAMLEQVKAAMKEAKIAKWKDKADEIKIKSTSTPLQDGDHEDVTFSAYKGSYFMSASKTVYSQPDSPAPKRPYRIIGPRKVKDPATGEMKFPDVKSGDEGAPYSGCEVNLKVEFWGQDADSERGIPARINATILAVQFAKHGDAFGGAQTRVDVDNEFDEEDVDGYEDDLSSDGGSKSNDLDEL